MGVSMTLPIEERKKIIIQKHLLQKSKGPLKREKPYELIRKFTRPAPEMFHKIKEDRQVYKKKCLESFELENRIHDENSVDQNQLTIKEQKPQKKHSFFRKQAEDDQDKKNQNDLGQKSQKKNVNFSQGNFLLEDLKSKKKQKDQQQENELHSEHSDEHENVYKPSIYQNQSNNNQTSQFFSQSRTLNDFSQVSINMKYKKYISIDQFVKKNIKNIKNAKKNEDKNDCIKNEEHEQQNKCNDQCQFLQKENNQNQKDLENQVNDKNVEAKQFIEEIKQEKQDIQKSNDSKIMQQIQNNNVIQKNKQEIKKNGKQNDEKRQQLIEIQKIQNCSNKNQQLAVQQEKQIINLKSSNNSKISNKSNKISEIKDNQYKQKQIVQPKKSKEQINISNNEVQNKIIVKPNTKLPRRRRNKKSSIVSNIYSVLIEGTKMSKISKYSKQQSSFHSHQLQKQNTSKNTDSALKQGNRSEISDKNRILMQKQHFNHLKRKRVQSEMHPKVNESFHNQQPCSQIQSVENYKENNRRISFQQGLTSDNFHRAKIADERNTQTAENFMRKSPIIGQQNIIEIKENSKFSATLSGIYSKGFKTKNTDDTKQKASRIIPF